MGVGTAQVAVFERLKSNHFGLRSAIKSWRK
jgi:hypothetical protein